ncbi:MAG: NAD(P)H-hydrate dehydratase [Methylotenera sp.]
MNSVKIQLQDEYSTLPSGLYSGESVREMDQYAIEKLGIDGYDLMNKAARFSFHVLIKQWPKVQNILVLCGSGNNAGDGYLVAALAKKRGLAAQVLYTSDPSKLTNDAQSAYQHCLSYKVNCLPYQTDSLLQAAQQSDTVVVDALLGTGLNKPVTGLFLDAITTLNTLSLPVVAIDIPSGLSASTGTPLGIAVQASMTATFIGLKLGLFTGAGRQYCGKIRFSDLALPLDQFDHITPLALRLDLQVMLRALQPRPQDSHKGNHGHLAILGGDLKYGGAVVLAAMAAARMGAGLTSVITQATHKQSILAHIPEAMVYCGENFQELSERLQTVDAIVIGPGLGQSAWSEKLLLCALNSGKQLVLDADALNLISQKHPKLFTLETFRKQQHVLTPHPGEAARLIETSTRDIQADRDKSLTQLHQKWGNHLLLKGSGSLISDSHNRHFLCPYGNPGMASGGMGDVLSGLIGGLIVQNMAPDRALKLAVCLHAKAADIVAETSGQRGLLASDLIPVARTLLNATH